MSVSDDRPQSAPRRRRRLRKPTWRGWFTIGLITLIVAIVAAWAIDYGTLHGRIARNTTVENVDLSRLDGAPLDAALARADARYGKGTVVFIIDGHDHPMSAGDLGLHVDAGATLAAARKVGRSDPPVLRPVDWVLSWIRPRRVPITVTLDQAKLTRALATLPGQTPVVEPRIVGTIDTVGTSPGSAGYGFDAARVAPRIEAAARDGALPIRVPLVAETIQPTVSDAEITLLAKQAQTLTDRTLAVTIPGRTMDATPAVLRSWITSVVDPGRRHAHLAMSGPRVVHAARLQLGIVVTAPQPATFTVENSQVLLVPQVDGSRCCSLSSGDAVMQALQHNDPTVALPLIKQPPSFTTAKAQALGITTLLGSGLPAQTQQMWQPPNTSPTRPSGPGEAGTSKTTTTTTTTTTLPAGPAGAGSFVVPIPDLSGQTQNIDQAIPLVRGRILAPGAQLSLNSIIGPPSPDRGFVPAQVATADGPTWISGGGTDLLAAALFEAAYQSGLDIPTSTRHLALPVGVTPGIEADLGWTAPDLVIANPSKNSVLIWVDRVAGGVRVQLFGTPFTSSVATAPTETPFGPGGACLAVSVTRTRTFLDGHRVTDTFSGKYTPPPAGRDDPDRVICPG